MADTHPAHENIAHLAQGIRLMRALDDAVFVGSAGDPFRGGIGSQFRHCIDFYHCLLQGYPEGKVNYSARLRDARVETDREHAAQQAEQVVQALASMRPEDAGLEIQVRSDVRVDSADWVWSRSTVHRELQFLASHTIHHHALIVSLLRLQGVTLGDEFAEFGVAPSTTRHWNATDPIVG